MGQDADWLYNVIFAEIAAVWVRLHTEERPPASIAPERLYIQEYVSADWVTLQCQEPIRCMWMYDGNVFQAIPEGKSIIHNQTIRGQFFVNGSVHFHVSLDRSRILWNAFFGPRYGRGMVFCIVGQGIDAKLVQDKRSSEWVS